MLPDSGVHSSDDDLTPVIVETPPSHTSTPVRVWQIQFFTLAVSVYSRTAAACAQALSSASFCLAWDDARGGIPRGRCSLLLEPIKEAGKRAVILKAVRHVLKAPGLLLQRSQGAYTCSTWVQ